jgi:hypothetical protein
MYRRLNKPVDHERLLRTLIGQVNEPWFNKVLVDDPVTLQVVTRSHQIICDQQGRSEHSVVMNLIKAARLWDRQSQEMRDCPAKHLLKWNSALIESALLDAFM